jgi:hypothetical protein
MIAAAGIKIGGAIWTLVAASQILRDAQFVSAGATEYGRLVPVRLWPDLYRVVCQCLVALLAGVIDATTFHLDGNDVEVGPVMSAPCLGIEINPANLRVRQRHRGTDYRNPDELC